MLFSNNKTLLHGGREVYLLQLFLNRLIVSLLHVFLGILSPRIWPNDHREVNERMKEVLMMEWHGMVLSASGWSVALLTVKCGCR